MKITDSTAYRVWPKKQFGGMPNMDQFIEPGDNPTNHPSLRWKVDATHFPNLTLAREYVRSTLALGDNTELFSHAEYTPGTGYTCNPSTKTKGSTMLRKKTTAADIQLKIEAAQGNLKALEGIDTTSMLDPQLADHQKQVKNAKAAVAYQASVLRKLQQIESPDAPASKSSNSETFTTATVKPASPAPVEHLPQRMDRMPTEPTHHPRYEISFPTAVGGRQVSVKVNDTESLDNVFAMMMKHGL